MKVVIGVIKDDNNRILITQRCLKKSQGGLWEFPGGKVEPLEAPETALIRELQEELGIIAIHPIYLGAINHQYKDQPIKLIIYQINKFTGRPSCLENQLSMQWVQEHQLSQINFPEANSKILKLICKKIA